MKNHVKKYAVCVDCHELFDVHTDLGNDTTYYRELDDSGTYTLKTGNKIVAKIVCATCQRPDNDQNIDLLNDFDFGDFKTSELDYDCVEYLHLITDSHGVLCYANFADYQENFTVRCLVCDSNWNSKDGHEYALGILGFKNEWVIKLDVGDLILGFVWINEYYLLQVYRVEYFDSDIAPLKLIHSKYMDCWTGGRKPPKKGLKLIELFENETKSQHESGYEEVYNDVHIYSSIFDFF